MTGDVVVRATVAPMHAEARVSSAQVSQQLAGHVVTVLATEGDWLRVRGEDGYEGWMHRGYVAEHAAGLTFPDRRLSLGCVVRDPNGDRALPLGAWVDADSKVVSGETVAAAARATRFPRSAKAICDSAVERFVGTPYQWGGVTPWGADCSGIVQTTFWLHGVMLPRDAWQQAESGVDVEVDWASFQPADLVFFSDRADRRITHVGIALGRGRMVHLALGRGGYSIESLTAPADDYTSVLITRCVSARRVL
jgi:cell wall-associated NlpC family hydrolase